LAPSGAVSRIRANLAALAVLRTLRREARPATPAEQAVLARWSGWGAVPEVFDSSRGEYAWARDQLTGLLSPAELAAARRNTLNAHYTGAALVKAIWDGARKLGFTGGRVLEPGCGSGNFIAFAPASAQVTGVELDPVTAGIAAALYPDAQVLTESFVDTRDGDGSYDLAIGNVPFGKAALRDQRHNPGGHSIHNHFIVKSLHLTRPGGLVLLLTSRYTMDARNPAARREIASLADLIGAIRLPSRAHQQTAGTSVVTDLLILRRREPGRPPDATVWEQARLTDLDGVQVPVNEYFLSRPQAVLGQLGAVHGAYNADDLVVRATADPPAALAQALAELAASARSRRLTWAPAATEPVLADEPRAFRSEEADGYLRAHSDGTFTRVERGTEVSHEVPRSQAGELRDLLGLRDAARALLAAEAASRDDTPELAALRAELNRRYDAYLRGYGPVNRYTVRRTGRVDPVTGEPVMARIQPVRGGFRDDPYTPLVHALEEFEPVGQRAAKAAIFRERVLAPRTPRLGADTPGDALAICLDTRGDASLAEIARLLGTSEEEARTQLGTLVFDDPQSGRLVPAAEYLSGNVRDKLRTAETAAADDPRFAVNVTELRQVIPRDLPPGEIDARLGASWISAAWVEQFLRETLDDPRLQVEHPGGQVWGVRGNDHSVLAASTWGTPRYPAPALAQAILEQRKIEVRDIIDTPDGERRVLNLDATLAAQEKAAELAARFSDWAWEDPGRARELARTYNDRFNSLVLRSYDDAELSLPGLAVTFRPRPHQVAAVARMIHEPSVLLAHEVGAGKTAEMIIGITELRRLGLARKPAVVVPNHMLEQFSREWLQTYPRAHILVARREDMRADRRRQFVARCATGNWDGIVMSRSAFERIPLSADEQRAYLDRELDEMRTWIETARKGGGGLTVKRLEGALLRAEERLKAKLDSAKDPGITFEATGIDYLAIDEAHGYKNLRTTSNISDAAIDGSMRASDLDMKIGHLRRRNGRRVVTFATATPIANSVTEAYVMQRYLRPDLLADAGISVFDSWAATFGQVVTQVELAPEGGDSFRLKGRLARFANTPEMLRMFHVAADIKTADDLKLPVPAIARREDGQRVPEVVTVEPSDELLDYVAELGDRADKVRTRAVGPEEDNMLKISGDGRRAALDLRLIGLPQETPGKTAVAAERIATIWGEHRDREYRSPDGRPYPVRGSLQIVFCDLGTPGPGWNVYAELRDQLTARGLPRESVRFIHEAKTDRDKAQLFAACRAGRVAVLVGSTEKMGIGTNVQDRALALHHLDAPWRPADVAQREGRILRQGNLNPEVQVIRYVTAQSFDGYSWQTLERKARFIGQVMHGRFDSREISDIGDTALSFSEVKALATGNPLLMDKADADAALARLQRAERAYHRNQAALEHAIAQHGDSVRVLTQQAVEIDVAIDRRQDTRSDAFTMTIRDLRHDKRATAGQHFKDLLMQEIAELDGVRIRFATLGSLGGFAVTAAAERSLGKTTTSITLDGVPGGTLRLSADDVRTADPAGLISRLENRLHRLETRKGETLSDIERARREIAHAREALGQPFPQAAQLAEARERARQIDEKLDQMAAGHQAEHAAVAHQPDRGSDAHQRQAGTAPQSATAHGASHDQPAGMARAGEYGAQDAMRSAAGTGQQVPERGGDRSYELPSAQTATCQGAESAASSSPAGNRGREPSGSFPDGRTEHGPSRGTPWPWRDPHFPPPQIAPGAQEELQQHQREIRPEHRSADGRQHLPGIHDRHVQIPDWRDRLIGRSQEAWVPRPTQLFGPTALRSPERGGPEIGE
jgi:N12 class adenine-specific DNA methylase/SAM-dependent methyltransferase